MPERRIMREVFSRLDDVTQKGRDISDEPTAQLMPEETTTDERAHDTVVRGRVLPTAEERAARKIKYKEPPKNPREPKIINRHKKEAKEPLPRRTWDTQDPQKTAAFPNRSEQIGRNLSSMLEEITKIRDSEGRPLPNDPNQVVQVAPDRPGVLRPNGEKSAPSFPGGVIVNDNELPGAVRFNPRHMTEQPTEQIDPQKKRVPKKKQNSAPHADHEAPALKEEPTEPPKKSFFRRLFDRR